MSKRGRKVNYSPAKSGPFNKVPVGARLELSSVGAAEGIEKSWGTRFAFYRGVPANRCRAQLIGVEAENGASRGVVEQPADCWVLAETSPATSPRPGVPEAKTR